MDAWIIAGARTPIGKLCGSLSTESAPFLGAAAIRASVARGGVSPDDVDEVIMGNVLQAGVGQAPARQAALLAGLPETVAAVTVNKVCGSGLKAVEFAAQAVRLGDANVVVAGGMESMSQAPHVAHGLRRGQTFGDVALQDAMMLDGLVCAFEKCAMGMHAEHTASEYDISRKAQDAYAAESQRRAASAAAEHRFDAELVSVESRRRKEVITVASDEGPRPDTTTDSLAKLKPAFSDDGTVTAGNASMISDGAAAVVVVNEEIAVGVESPWKARIVASHTSGTAPRDLFIAPVDAVRGVLAKAQLTADEIDLFEINEAFAAQLLACLADLKLDPAKVNVNGGAIALGHPIGASGARVLVTLLAELHRQQLRRGIAALCLGGGNAIAMLVERGE